MSIITVIDLETSGLTDPRIVEFAAVQYGWPDMVLNRLEFRCNPGVPIDPAATAVHGISDADVVRCKPFSAFAFDVVGILGAADYVGGFNVAKFDLQVLQAEMRRASVLWAPREGAVIDAMVLYHKLRPRTLEAAFIEATGEMLQGAHAGMVDVEATFAVLRWLAREFVTRDLAELEQRQGSIGAAFGGVLTRAEGGQLRWAVGKYKGKSVDEVAKNDFGYVTWALGSDFPETVKAALRDALKRRGVK